MRLYRLNISISSYTITDTEAKRDTNLILQTYMHNDRQIHISFEDTTKIYGHTHKFRRLKI